MQKLSSKKLVFLEEDGLKGEDLEENGGIKVV